MNLTPDIVKAAYEFLTETPPFDKWNLPAAEDVKFVVTRSRITCGSFSTSTSTIEISSSLHSHTYSLLETLAHELVHMHMRQTAMDRGVSDHGTAFRKLAEQVCKQHGFDPKSF